MVSNNILAFFLENYKVVFYNSLYRGMRIIVAYAFLVQYFKNVFIVAYAGLRVNVFSYSLCLKLSWQYWQLFSD